MVEDVEKYFLCFFFSTKELDVVDDNKVEVGVGLDKGVGFVFAYFLDELCGKLFGGNVEDFFVGVVLLYVVGDGLYEVGFGRGQYRRGS